MAVDRRDVLYQGVNSNGRNVRRPKSPHLSVYRIRLSMLMSIGNRAAGAASAGGLALLAFWFHGLAKGGRSFERASVALRHPLGRATLVGWVMAASYHVVIGLRHLIWDDARRIEKKQINADGPPLLLGAALLAGAVLGGWVAALRRQG